jgi:hypothetical protein
LSPPPAVPLTSAPAREAYGATTKFVGAVTLAAALGLCSTLAAACGSPVRDTRARQDLFAELTPSKVANCNLRRYGAAHDGGYLMCENLMGEGLSAYSYGIDGRDEWGCDISEQVQRIVHEYDCFNLTRPACNRGSFLFHAECIGGERTKKEGRVFDTLEHQLARNGDSDRHLIVKMDVEGAEWESLLATPDAVLDRIDQLAIEFHRTDDALFLAAAKKLRRHFVVGHFHANNYACEAALAPFTSWANEVLFVNNRIAVLDPSGERPTGPNALDAPNDPSRRDCQRAF